MKNQEQVRKNQESFMNKLNSNDPKCEPWGTLELTKITLDTELDNLTNWYIPIR